MGIKKLVAQQEQTSLIWSFNQCWL